MEPGPPTREEPGKLKPRPLDEIVAPRLEAVLRTCERPEDITREDDPLAYLVLRPIWKAYRVLDEDPVGVILREKSEDLTVIHHLMRSALDLLGVK